MILRVGRAVATSIKLMFLLPHLQCKPVTNPEIPFFRTRNPLFFIRLMGLLSQKSYMNFPGRIAVLF